MTIRSTAGRRKASFLALSGLAALTMASAASAQEAQPDAEGTTAVEGSAQQDESVTTAARSDENIIITGTRVARDGYQAPTPLTVLTRDDIENSSPTNNIADFVNQLPSLAGSTRPSNSRLNLSSGQAGINALNLRNLGEVRTLVLLDGRRSVASTITGLVDVNTIPQLLVDRVEVVTGGASATYGSDAVGGVVNFILDKKFEGLKLQADGGITTYGDGFNYSAGLAAGKSFAGGRGHVILSGEIAHRDGIFEVDRDWNATGYVRIQNPAYNATTNSSVPQFLIRRQVGPTNSTPGSIILNSAGGTANRLRGIYFGPGGSVNQFRYGDLTFPSPTGSAPPTLTQGGDWQVNDSGRRIGLDAEDDRRSLFGRISFDVADGVTLFAEASYNWQEVLFNAGPNLASTTSAPSLANVGAGSAGSSTLAGDNAFLIQALGAQRLAGITAVTIGTTAADLPFRAANNVREVQRYVIGAEGEFELLGKAARWDVYGQYGRADLREQLRNIMHTQRTAQAVDAVFSVPGNTSSPIVCRINADANPNNNDPNCVPLNRLGIGVANPAAIDYILGDPYRDEVVEQIVTGANFSFTPFATWAGDVSVAVGGEYREEKIRGFVPAEFQPTITPNPAGGVTTLNAWSVGNYLPTNGKYNVKEAYFETVVPLGLGLEFNGAVRATDYSSSGYVTTWRAGATWQPIPDIRLRVTRSHDIRAPNLNELFQAGSSNTDAVRNPFFPGSGPLGNTYGSSISYSATATGNPNLRPEKADSWNVGAVVSPRFLPGFSASVDYFRIEMEDVIDFLTAQNIVDRCFEGVQEYCDAIVQDPNNASRILLRNQPFNFASKLVRGVDFEASYRQPLDSLFAGANGNVTLRGVATRYIDNITDTGVPGFIPLDTVGFNGGQYSTPKWIYRFSATYDTDRYAITGVARGVSAGKYLAGVIECQTDCPVSTTQFPTYDDIDIKGAFYVDLNFTAKFDALGRGNGEFFVNITNLLDADPILLPETGLAANSTYSDLLGRAFRAGIRLRFR
ncbi:TonB-dependent siderophore receptor [Sphingosinicella sp. BN140058]|uniref:TonB-dependent receptor plug domain-containing protein n=1 Tax=Sphingosinicella sp. BN140058 TaxID=1892855 RepID=UPI001013A928|nr:TonB-dependent receptor [Sphingosinicella sp. BN140058]QAY76200.1 TonB-dependent receptor [Sphingosinicella sp. BN140058]